DVEVPAGKDVGGSFATVPLCRAKSQTGCVVAYSSFRANAPPAPGGRIGGAARPGMVTACVNPAALGGGPAELDASLATRGDLGGLSEPAPAWTTPPRAIETPWVRLPGLLSGECVATVTGAYLAVTVHADANDARADDINGDVVVSGRVRRDWGLHLV